MFKNLRFSAISWIFIGLMLAMIIVIAVSGYAVDHQTSAAEKIWQTIQSDYTEKMRLQNEVVEALGFGGMIQAYKEYQINSSAHPDRFITHAGTVNLLIRQYMLLPLSQPEETALSDLQQVVEKYTNSVHSGNKLQDITATIDLRAIRALDILKRSLTPGETETNTSRIQLILDLKRKLGFGGVVHHFNNYVISADVTEEKLARQSLRDVRVILLNLQQSALSQADRLAVDDIASTIDQYESGLDQVTFLHSKHVDYREISASVHIDDKFALNGLRQLDKTSVHEYENLLESMASSLGLVRDQTNYVMWFAIISVIILSVLAFNLIHQYIISPIRKLAENVGKIAAGDLLIENDFIHDKNEIGDMARAVQVFKQTTLDYKESEAYLSRANDAITAQIQDIHQWRKKANEQTAEALELARGLSVAREAAEKATARAERDEKRIRLILETVRDALITINQDGFIETFNPGAEAMFGYFKHEVIGKNVSILMPEEMAAKHEFFVRNFVSGHADRVPNIAVEQPAKRKNGEIFPVEISLSTMNDNGQLKITALMRDATERVKRDEEIKRLAMTDPLTGLANRNQYQIRLEDAERFARRSHKYFALLQLDLDKFKPINDTYGHPFGDKVLINVAEVLKSICREIDTVARIGGDEFSIILLDIDSMSDVQTPVDRIIEMMDKPMEIDGESITVGISIGIACYGMDSGNLAELIRFADQALYVAKDIPGSVCKYYKNIAETAKNVSLIKPRKKTE